MRPEKCKHCDSTELNLVWAAMESWDFDSWQCRNGHTFAWRDDSVAP